MNAEHKEHILPLKIYLSVAGALFILTLVTVSVSYVDLGGWNIVVALAVASFKASLVALFFMHLKYDNKIHMFILLASIFFVAVFIIITMFDTLRRTDIYDIRGEPIQKEAIIYESAPAESSNPNDDF